MFYLCSNRKRPVTPTKEVIMDCPICGAVAENITSPGFDGLGVRCHNCKDFDVADAVLNQLLRMDIEERTAALEKARRLAPPGERPVINSISLN
jgi:hypothetical protein